MLLVFWHIPGRGIANTASQWFYSEDQAYRTTEAASCRGTERVVRLRRAVEGKVVEITVAEESPGPSPGKNTV